MPFPVVTPTGIRTIPKSFKPYYEAQGTGCCGCFLFIMLINLTIGAVAFDYALYSLWGKEIPWYGDMACGAIMGEVAVPVALVCLIMRLCGVQSPFFP